MKEGSLLKVIHYILRILSATSFWIKYLLPAKNTKIIKSEI